MTGSLLASCTCRAVTIPHDLAENVRVCLHFTERPLWGQAAASWFFFWCLSDFPVSKSGRPALTGKINNQEWINWYWGVRRTSDPGHSQHLAICCQISCRGMDLRFVFVSRGWAAYPKDCCWPPHLSTPTTSPVSPWCSCGYAASWSSRPVWLKTNRDVWDGTVCCWRNHVADPAGLWPRQHQHKTAGGNGECGEGGTTSYAVSTSLTLMGKLHPESVCHVI